MSPEVAKRPNDQEWDDESRLSPSRNEDEKGERDYEKSDSAFADMMDRRVFHSSKKIPLPMKYPRRFTLDATRQPVAVERDEWVVLNVGGTRYETYVSTLRSYPSIQYFSGVVF